MGTDLYFTKFLPAEGEIKVGDKLRSESFSKHAVTVTSIDDEVYWTDELDLADPMGSYYGIKREKAIKLSEGLYLCSRNINVGDTVYDSTFPWRIVESVTGNNEGTLAYAKSIGAFKVIGEVSSFALKYVKEKDEFTKEQIMYSGRNYASSYPNSKDPHSGRDYLNVYLIMGPCGHFH